jgi:hypothetical protein
MTCSKPRSRPAIGIAARVRELAAGTRDLAAEGGRWHYYRRHKTKAGTRRCFHPISGTSRAYHDTIHSGGAAHCFRQVSSALASTPSQPIKINY